MALAGRAEAVAFFGWSARRPQPGAPCPNALRDEDRADTGAAPADPKVARDA